MSERERDIVERLREAGSIGLDLSPGDPLCAEAADEIERLRAQCAEWSEHVARVERINERLRALSSGEPAGAVWCHCGHSKAHHWATTDGRGQCSDCSCIEFSELDDAEIARVCRIMDEAKGRVQHLIDRELAGEGFPIGYVNDSTLLLLRAGRKGEIHPGQRDGLPPHAIYTAEALAAREGGSEWQPIDTAPKNEPVLVAWIGENMWPTRATKMPDGFWWSWGRKFDEPTHWMPLPEPPAVRLRTGTET